MNSTSPEVPPVKILCLFVRHGTQQYPEALSTLDQWYERHGLTDRRTLWIIDNALAGSRPPEHLTPRTVLRSGDNRGWEFSAWSLALRQAAESAETYDLVHFVTSAFNTLYTEYLQHFDPGMLTYALARNICLGHIDSYPAPVQLGAATSQSWVRTCFFFLPWIAARPLSPWVAYEDPTRFFVSPTSRQFRLDAPLSREYQASITAWLEGREIGGHTWHSPVRDSTQENARFQQKTLAILNEHQLAISLRSAGIALADFCWLYALRATPLAQIPDPLPEQAQLKIRRKILGIPE